ncbi:Uncharacterised protein [Bordetella pertussis]|nr:Uncharacterised protein [Bordetella pertussis]CFL87844.1 Uncharacterised protein [Bordetella pertussis]CFM10962.1 Uncharacterised protein [Bordetella pertussis]CFM28439.1 Uncharacterised protein [Bordetella pertussis]CFM40610.1 Uncharacterised protein [Bordetella pertussis]
MPGVKQACPNVAACWSPATPAMGIEPPSHSGRVSPMRALLGAMRGNMPRGMFKRARISSDQSWACRSNSMVREALLGSVLCTAPPVSCQTSQVSIVPKASSPRSAILRAPGT